MKKKLVKSFFFKTKNVFIIKNLVLSFACLTFSLVGAQNTITLKSLPGGSEGITLYTDSSIISINSLGVASYKNSTTTDDWSVSSTTISQTGALNKEFSVILGGMNTVKTSEGKKYGSLLTQGGIDRAAAGDIGVRGGLGGGIENNEGIQFGLDLSKIDPSASIQITKIYVNLAGSPDENNVVVSLLNPFKRISFGTEVGVNKVIGNGEESIDISSFNLYISGGEINNSMLSIFNDSKIPNNFRVTGCELKVLSNTLDTSLISSVPHPRLLLKQGEEALIQNLINNSPDYKKIHDFIINTANSYLSSPTIVKPTSGRITDEVYEALYQITFLSYAYRMTLNNDYATKAESVINTVCSFDNWTTYSLDVAEMTYAVAIGYDWLYNKLSETTKQKARNAILNFALIPQKNQSFWESTSNWNQVCIGGLSTGAIAIFGDGTTQMNSEASIMINRILVENPKSMIAYANGNYQEGPMYWSYGTTYEAVMLSALEQIYGMNHEGINRLIQTPGFLESVNYMQYVTGPTSLYFNYSDSTERKLPLAPALWMAKKANNPSLLYVEKNFIRNNEYLSSTSGIDRFLPIALIWAKDINLVNLAEPESKLWVGYGDQPVALVRTAWKGSTGKYFGVKAGTPNYSHAQMDQGSFVYDSQGLRWVMDLGKYSYDPVNTYLASLTPPRSASDYTQNSLRWDIFRVSNLNHNNLSIKKSSETSWQHYNASGIATIDEVYDTTEKRGAKINLNGIIGLNNELKQVNRTINMINNDYLEIKDFVSNGAESIDLYWNLVTTAIVEKINDSQIRLTQGGKTVVVDFVSSNPAVGFTFNLNRSTDPVDYFSTATYEEKNTGVNMFGFTCTIPANNDVTFTVTIKDSNEVPPSSVQPINSILLEMPTPLTALEGNFFYNDQSAFFIDSDGKVSITGRNSKQYAWEVYGQTDIVSSSKQQFIFKWDAMETTNTTLGTDYGALLTRQGIDRDGLGDLGVRYGSSTAIDPNEGFRLGLDLLDVSPAVVLKLSKIGVSSVSGGDRGTVVNRNDTSKRITFGAAGSGANVSVSGGYVDVESLGIQINGGQTFDDIASIFNSATTGNFRISKFIFKVSFDPSALSTDDFNDGKNMEREIIVYPNPFSEVVNIKNISSNTNIVRLKLFNSNGSCLFDKKTDAFSIDQELPLDFQNLNKGIYLLQIIEGNKITTKKIVKQ